MSIPCQGEVPKEDSEAYVQVVLQGAILKRIRRHMSAYEAYVQVVLQGAILKRIRQNTSAYVSIRQNTSVILQHTST